MESMNPFSMIRLTEAVGEEPRHIIDICFLTRLSTSTVYKAHRLGYLEREDAATFWATDKLIDEVKNKYGRSHITALPAPQRR